MKYKYRLLSWLTLLMLWIILFFVIDHRLILPSPIDVLLALGRLAGEGSSFAIMGLTLIRLLISVLASAFLGIALGLISGIKKKASEWIHPYITLFRTIPILSIIVILIIILGYQVAPYVITFFIVFPIIYQATEDGILNIDISLVDAYRLEEHHLKIAVKELYLPLIKPYIVLSLLQSFGLGLKVLVMAEFLAQTKTSMGEALYLAKTNLNYDQVFAWTIILILISVIFESLITSYRKRMLELT
ncbi:MAG: hypothetical protein A2Y45_03625 [Tenericutes bacterium GWC2_34_14]|nr:MAG: hypothetical protein A2Y45_03625 [Tenericutes bacterium GWC2_34_14]OHE34307.1 MAG: hypothetical protein A2012_09215 [Tenericutes bacterium GWE2_34_108]OHE46345.1 MAG: hypothetical protein A2308_02475 [Tenericutes bacterium RIFOXYB2_FULL_36_25]OHE46462.1 MAG: hypothetical protein A3K26_05040 [Tenericutes bacterium RIFOXYA12_FULL_35_10]OHE51466.1 MAG: hypothetical protein A2558_06210 [Tenericutes bacterium RIFOXYD2_FULL_35_11]HAX02365.1 hypothetical protein [Acholeplasmataceae bacterium]